METHVMIEKPPAEARTWAMIIYLSCFTGLIIPLGSIIAPLIIWLLKKEEHPFIERQGKEVLNFNLSIIVIFLSLFVLNFVMVLTVILAPLAFLLMLALFLIGVYALIIIIIGAIKVKDGFNYRIPYLNFRLIQ